MDDAAPALKPVTTLYESNARMIPAMLRMSADSIEKERDEGYSPTVAMVAVQLCANGDALVYGWGDTDNLRAIGTLHLGLTEIARIQLGVPVSRD